MKAFEGIRKPSKAMNMKGSKGLYSPLKAFIGFCPKGL
jgi:hypothetical protein